MTQTELTERVESPTLTCPTCNGGEHLRCDVYARGSVRVFRDGDMVMRKVELGEPDDETISCDACGIELRLAYQSDGTYALVEQEQPARGEREAIAEREAT